MHFRAMYCHHLQGENEDITVGFLYHSHVVQQLRCYSGSIQWKSWPEQVENFVRLPKLKNNVQVYPSSTHDCMHAVELITSLLWHGLHDGDRILIVVSARKL